MWIGVSGKMGTGKDYIATSHLIPFIEKTLGKKCMIVSFADMIKINVMVHNNITIDMLTGDKTNEVRTLLRQEGQGKKRDFGDDIWIRYTKAIGDMYMARGIDYIIITDVRFKNEYKFIEDMNGVIIRINAPNRNETRLRRESNNDEQYMALKNHISETELDDCTFKYVINNDNDNITEIYNVFHNIFI